jgi:hypothetical protein
VNRPRSNPSTGSLAAVALAVAFAAASCSDPPAAPPATTPEAPLLTIDGITITFGDAEPFQQYLASIAPEWGKKTRLRAVLDEYLIPLHLARRAFAKERAAARADAEALRSVATNVAELEQHSKLLSHRRKVLARRQIELPASMFLFDPLTTGAASDPIEVPRGFYVLGAFELRESALKVDDLADTLQVGFTTHDIAAFAKWLDAEQTRIANRVTFVHPDYRDAMPPWMQLD